MIEHFHRILFHITRVTAWVGMIFLLGAVVVSAADILLRQIGQDGIFGTVDLVQLMVMSAAYLAIPYGFLSQSHVSVTLLVDRFGRRMNAVSKLLAAFLATGLMGAIALFGYDQAMLQVAYGDISMNLGIPKIYYWLPLLFGSALSALVCVHMAVEALYTALTGRSAVTAKPLKEAA